MTLFFVSDVSLSASNGSFSPSLPLRQTTTPLALQPADGTSSLALLFRDPAEFAAMKRLWSPLWGDRRQELAIIGVGLDETALRTRLDACLLNDAELATGPLAWQHYPDPFPRWQRQRAEEAAH